MSKYFFHLILQALLLLPFLSVSQEVVIKRSNNKVSLNGKNYYIHIVRKSETLYGISNAYNVPVDSIKTDNLHISDNLSVNQYIKVRIVDLSEDQKKESIIYHKVVKGDTPFNISRRYNVSITSIYKANPNAELGIKIGEVLKIPVKKIAPENVDVETFSDKSDKEGFIMHKVEKKETKYGIAKKYNTTVEEIDKLNSELLTRELNTGEFIKIPISKKEDLNATNVHYHLVQKQETVYGLTKLYNISEKSFAKLNPDVKKRGLHEGELVMIPKNRISDSIFAVEHTRDSMSNVIAVSPINKTIDTYFTVPCPKPSVDTQNTYKVAFFMPLHLNINDTLGKFVDKVVIDEDGVKTIESVPRQGKIKDKIYSRSRMFLEFYEGALLALNELKHQGMSFEIHIFDTQNDSAHVANLLASNNLTDFNLFIGPFYSEILNIVSDYAWEYQINIVSPLSMKNSFIEHNPYAFQVSPPFEVQMLHASEYLNQFDTKNYIVIHDGKNLNQEYLSAFKKELYSQMNDSNLMQFKYNEVYYYDARDSVLKDVFTPEIENIVIVPSNNQAFVSDVMGKINGYSYNYNITTFGQPRWINFANIELESFHNTNTHIFSNSYIDYSKTNVQNFVKTYRSFYDNEPRKYAFHGFDITKYFLSALNKYGHEFRKCIHDHEANLLQTKYNFVPYADQGGFQNTAIYILEYSKENKLVKKAEYPE